MHGATTRLMVARSGCNCALFESPAFVKGLFIGLLVLVFGASGQQGPSSLILKPQPTVWRGSTLFSWATPTAPQYSNPLDDFSKFELQALNITNIQAIGSQGYIQAEFYNVIGEDLAIQALQALGYEVEQDQIVTIPDDPVGNTTLLVNATSFSNATSTGSTAGRNVTGAGSKALNASSDANGNATHTNITGEWAPWPVDQPGGGFANQGQMGMLPWPVNQDIMGGQRPVDPSQEGMSRPVNPGQGINNNMQQGQPEGFMNNGQGAWQRPVNNGQNSRPPFVNNGPGIGQGFIDNGQAAQPAVMNRPGQQGAGGGTGKGMTSSAAVEEFIPNDQEWGRVAPALYQINAPEAWTRSTGSKQIKVCVIDSGVQFNHPDLQDNMPSQMVRDVVQDTAAGADNDERGHGTHCAGIIGAVGNNWLGVVGVAWSVDILGCKFMDSSGSGKISDAIKCIQWCREQGAHITSNSWGSSGAMPISRALVAEIDISREAGTLFVAAAGNTQVNLDVIQTRPFDPSAEGVITVGSTDVWGNARAGFSNYGSGSVHLFAPGVNITSTVPGGEYSIKSGTSMAAPKVAGAAALLWSSQPAATAAQVKAALLAGVDKLPDFSNSISQGRLNVLGAMNSLAASQPLFKSSADCEDTSSECKQWSSAGLCSVLSLWKAKSIPYELCPSTCGVCSQGSETQPISANITGVWNTGTDRDLRITYHPVESRGYAVWVNKTGEPIQPVQTLKVRSPGSNVYFLEDSKGRVYVITRNGSTIDTQERSSSEVSLVAGVGASSVVWHPKSANSQQQERKMKSKDDDGDGGGDGPAGAGKIAVETSNEAMQRLSLLSQAIAPRLQLEQLLLGR